MGNETDIIGRMRRLIERLAPTGVCGPCTAALIGGASLEQVQLGLSELTVMRGFERDNSACGLCSEQRLAIRKRG